MDLAPVQAACMGFLPEKAFAQPGICKGIALCINMEEHDI